MKITQLIIELVENLELHGNIDVILSRDGEGNSASPLADVVIEGYAGNTSYSGDTCDIHDIRGLEGYKKSIVLYPTN